MTKNLTIFTNTTTTKVIEEGDAAEGWEAQMDFHEHFSVVDEVPSNGNFINRKLTSDASMRKYTQLMAVAGLVSQLKAGIS